MRLKGYAAELSLVASVPSRALGLEGSIASERRIWDP